MIRIASLALVLLLTACGQADQPAPAPIENKVAAAPAPKAVPSLDGQWQLKDPASLALTIGGGQATLASGCLRRGFTFTQDRNKVSFTSNPAGSSNCGRSPSAAEEAAFAALSDANLAVFGADGAATLSGTGGMIALQPR